MSKNAAQVYTLAALANFYLARDSLLATVTAGSLCPDTTDGASGTFNM